MLRSPAVRIVPGRPTAPINTNPLTMTPTAAPRLLVKYRVASVSPGRSGQRRMSPPLISGKVMPSSTDCGRMISDPKDHL